MPLIQQSGSVAIGTPIGSGSSGSVLFIDSSGNLSQDNTNLRFDDAANSLTVGGDLLFVTNNVSSIGATGTRPLKVWVGTGGIESSGTLVLSGSTTYGVNSIAPGAGAYSIQNANAADLTFRNTVGAVVLWGATTAQILGASIRLYDGTGSYYASFVVPSAGAIYQRNSTNTQTFCLDYYTDSSNYNRGRLEVSGTAFLIQNDTIGTYAGLSTLILRSQSYIAFDATTGHIDFRFAAANKYRAESTGFVTNTNDTMAIGGTSNRWNKGWFGTGGLDLTGGITATGVMYSGVGFFYTGTATGLRTNSASTVVLQLAGTEMIGSGHAAEVVFRQSVFVGFSSSATLTTSSPDTGWVRESAGTLAQRNGTNAQTWNIYGTYTDASNYFGGQITCNSSVLTIQNRGAGTGLGVNNDIQIRSIKGIVYDVATSYWHGWRVNNTDIARLQSTQFVPHVDDVLAFGGTSNRWKKGWFGTGGLDTTGNLSFASANTIIWTSRGTLSSPGSDILRWTNAAATGIFSLQVNASVSQFTGTSNLWSFQNGLIGQSLYVYRTYTDASNYAALQFIYTGSVALIRTIAAGTGIVADLYLQAASGVTQFYLSATASRVDCNASIIPMVNGACNIGTSALRYQTLFNQVLNVAPLDNSIAITVSGSTLTAANAQNLVSLAQTWNTSGNPALIYGNVTYTAAGTTSKLIRLDVGGVEYFGARVLSATSVALNIGNAAVANAVYDNGGVSSSNTSLIVWSVNGTATLMGGTAARFRSNLIQFYDYAGTAFIPLAVSTTSAVFGTSGNYGNLFEFRNTTNAQAFRVFRTYTDASNHAYLEQTWSGNNALIRTVGLGTGTVGELHLYGGSGGFSVQINSSGVRFDNNAYIYWGTRSKMTSQGDGSIDFTNTATTGFTRLTLGPTNSTSYPSFCPTGSIGTVELKNGNASAYTQLNLATVRPIGVTFANVPATPAVGMIICITDSNTATWGATIAGGGANNVIAFWNGANWTVMAA